MCIACSARGRVSSRPIVEHSARVRFAPYPAAGLPYPAAADHLAAVGLLEENGLWERVDDFGWLRATPSPNWGVLPEGERLPPPPCPPPPPDSVSLEAALDALHQGER